MNGQEKEESREVSTATPEGKKTNPPPNGGQEQPEGEGGRNESSPQKKEIETDQNRASQPRRGRREKELT